MARIRQSRPDSGLGFGIQGLEYFDVFPLASAALLVVDVACAPEES